MSNTRRARPRYARNARAERHLSSVPFKGLPDLSAEELGVVIGWADNAHVEGAKTQTHDTLIELMGEARTGGVRWYLIDDALAALAQLDRMRPGASPELLEVYDHVAGLVRELGGVLVIATAPGKAGWTKSEPE